MNEIEKRFRDIMEIKPDSEDSAAIRRIKRRDDGSEGITLKEMDELRSKIVEIPDDEVEFYSLYKKLSETNKKKAKRYISELLRVSSI